MGEEDDVTDAFGDIGFVPLDEDVELSLGDDLSLADFEPILLETLQVQGSPHDLGAPARPVEAIVTQQVDAQFQHFHEYARAFFSWTAAELTWRMNAQWHMNLQIELQRGWMAANTQQEQRTMQKKRARIGEDGDHNDLVDRHRIAKMTTGAEKLAMMVKIDKEKKESKLPLTGKAKTWVSRSLRPVMDCLKNHFEGNTELFLKKYPMFHHVTFQAETCNGKGSTCAPKSK